MMNHRQKKQKAKKKVKNENSAKAKTYNCSECTNSYASISGLRGHLRKKNMELQMQKVRRPFNILILYISLFDFFLSISPKMTFYQVFSCNVFTMFNEHVNKNNYTQFLSIYLHSYTESINF